MNAKTATTPRMQQALVSHLALIFAVCGSGGLSAQQTDAPAPDAVSARGGFHFSVGVGSASVGASCPGCEVDFFADRINGLSGHLQMGGALSSRLIIAAEFVGWIRNDDPIYRRIAALSLVVLGYPSAGSGFFIKGAAGGLRAIAENDFLRAQTDAYTSQTGVGYDIRLGGRTKLTPQATYVRTFGAATWFNGVSSPVAVTPNALQLALALTLN